MGAPDAVRMPNFPRYEVPPTGPRPAGGVVWPAYVAAGPAPFDGLWPWPGPKPGLGLLDVLSGLRAATGARRVSTEARGGVPFGSAALASESAEMVAERGGRELLLELEYAFIVNVANAMVEKAAAADGLYEYVCADAHREDAHMCRSDVLFATCC